MTVLEITLLILGVVIFALSFILPELKSGKGEDTGKKSEAQIKQMIEQEMEHVKERIDEVVDETIEYTIEKTERSLAKVSNEKIMAVNEYSDTVLEEINKNHKEVMFLYDMLNDKQIDLKNTVRKVEATKDEAVAAIQEATVAEPVAVQERVTRTPVGVGAVQEMREQQAVYEHGVQLNVGTGDSVSQKEVIPQPIFSSLANELDKMRLPELEDEKVINEKVIGAKTINPKAIGTTTINTAASNEAPRQKSGKNNNQRILELHKEGKSNVAIAKELGLGLGEVKLVIDLFEGV